MEEMILSLVEKLVDPVLRQFSYLCCYNANLESYKNQLRGLEMKGEDVKLLVEAAERNGEVIFATVEAWLKKVDAVSDESKRFVEEEDAISKCFFNGPLNLIVRYQRSRKAKKKASEFDEFKKDGLFHSVSIPAPPLQIGSVNNENEFDFESRRSIFNEIVDAIKDDGVQMIGIWGMPGIGKTTLVKKAAKYAKDEGLFEVVAMAVVSQKPSIRDIQGQIADKIGLKLTSESEEGRADQLLQRLLTILSRKKILIILDDIWDYIELNDIGIPSGNQHKGCELILTSRSRDVCEKMGTRKNFTINLLSANEALNLFLQKSGVDKDQFPEKGRRMAKELIKECGLLPLCIVIVARGLRNKELICWEDMLNQLRKSRPDRRVHATIELSYQNLDGEEEKTFFLLCALFPEDYYIPVQELFEYGLGLSLFERVDNADEALVRAYKLASSLKSSSLLLDEGHQNFVRMHDVIRDVALAIASEGKHAFLVPGKTATSFWDDDVNKLPDALECPHLQILMLNGRHPYFQLHDNFFAGMRNLIVLHIACMKAVRLPPSFADLENLRTLRFSYCDLGDISAIGKLRNLICLSFYGSNIQVLPKEVGELSKMRLLDFSNIRSLKVITPGVIQNLSQLEVLRVNNDFQWFDGKEVCHQENASLLELIHLPHLMILQICIPDASMLPDDVLFEKLTKFEVSIGSKYFKEMDIFSSNSQILKLISISENELLKVGIKMLTKKAQHLELLDISGISLALSSPLAGYESLKELIVDHCIDVNYVLDVSESKYEPETPSLQQLHLINLPLLKEISKGEFPSLFVSKLEHLKLHDLPSLVHLWQLDAKSVALVNLTIMSVESCEKLEYVFDNSSTKSLSKLKELEVGKCKNLQAICLSKELDDDIVFPQLSHLKLSELENVTSFRSKFTSESTLFGEQVMFLALETLHINNLEKLKKIWHVQTRVESFFQLKVLELTQCPELLVVFPPQASSALQNLEEICIENCHKLETLFQLDDGYLTVGDEMVLFPQLLTLKLVNLPKLTAILSTTSQNISQATVIFSAMEIMTLCRLHNLEMDQQLLTFFPKLKKLQLEGIGRLSSTADQRHIIKGLEALEKLLIKDNNGKILPQGLATLPKLSKLKLGFIHEPIELCERLNRCGGLQNLTSLNFFSCNGVKSLLRPSTVSCLVQLQELYVSECETMESIVGETSSEQNFDKAIEFSKLCTLKLDSLPHLDSFYDGQCAIKFPCLDNISIKDCPKMKIFASMSREIPEPSCHNFVSDEALFGQQVSFGRLDNLELQGLESIEEIWHCCHLATTVGELSELSIKGCDRLLKLFPSNLLVGLQNLKELNVRSCKSLKHVLAVEDHPPLLSNLEKLELYDLPELKQLWWNKNSRGSFGLPKLRYLRIDTCPGLQFIFDPSVADRLENLLALFVSNCSSMVEIGAEKQGEKMVFPLLRRLYLVNLPCFNVKQSVEFPQIENVWVYRCFNRKDSCVMKGRDELARGVRYFESFVE